MYQHGGLFYYCMIKKIFLTAGIFISLSIAALLAVFLVFTNPTHLKAQIVAQIYAQTGLHLQINGDIHWAFAPQLGISLTQVELRQPLAFNKNSSLTAAQVDVLVATRPLFSGKIVIQKILLHQFLLSFSSAIAKPAIAVTVGGDLQLSLPEQNLTIDHLTVDSGALHAVGKISGQQIFHAPELRGQLTFAHISLPNELGHVTNTEIRFHYTPNQPIAGTVTSSHWTVNHLDLSHIAAKFTANTHTIQLLDINSQLAGGKATGQVIITDFLHLPHYQIDATLSHGEMYQLLQADILQGPADLTAHLITLGADNTTLLAHLNGTLKLAAYNGILNHLDLLQQVHEIHQFLQTNPTMAAATGVTHFTQLTASGVINQGLFTNNDFLLQAPELQATGGGTVNLVDEQINYRVSVKVQGKFSGAAYNVAVPLKVAGTLSKPKVKIDLKAISFSLQPTDDQSKQLARTVHNEIKHLFGHHQSPTLKLTGN